MRKLCSSDKCWILVCTLLLIPALLVNLGMQPFLEDEAIRATVSLEMMFSGNYVTPTINGEYYYYKPPLYNWILIFFYRLLGGGMELIFRLPTIFFLLGFGMVIYLVYRKEGFNLKNSILSSFFFITCGRILFWDSFLGLIDICYSLVMYSMMVLMYLDAKKENVPMMYIKAYLLGSIGFMLKGYPTFLFLVLTLLLVLYLNKKIKALWHPAHLGGIILLGSIIGGYYFIYNQVHDVTETVSPLLDQATRRTGLKYNIIDVISHTITYPFENLYHFLPWSLMVVFLIRKDFFALLRRNPFVEFSFWAFIVNIVVYWVSPEVYPRYVLMLAPFVFTVFIFFYDKEMDIPTWRGKILESLFMAIVIGVPLVMVGSLLTQDLTGINRIVPKSIIIVGITVLFVWAYLRIKNQRLLIFVAILLMVRITFNFFVIPSRTVGNIATSTSKQAREIADKYGETGISMYRQSVIDFTSTFYMEKELGYILGRKNDTPYEIIDFRKYTLPAGYEVVDTFMIRRDRRILNVIRKNE